MALDELKASVDPSVRGALVLIIALVAGSVIVVVGLNLLDARIATVAKAERAVDQAKTEAAIASLVTAHTADSSKLDKLIDASNDMASELRVLASKATPEQRK